VNLLNRSVHPRHEFVRIYLGVLSVVKRGDLWDRGVRSFAALGTSGHSRPSHKFN
jgi:hypothetical protein